jgi:hypothetical protein
MYMNIWRTIKDMYINDPHPAAQEVGGGGGGGACSIRARKIRHHAIYQRSVSVYYEGLEWGLGLGFDRNDKFRVRPSSVEFILELSRRYLIACVSKSRGDCIKSGLFHILFVCEQTDLYLRTQQHQLNGTNSFILDVINTESDENEDMNIQYVYVNSYTRNNIRDDELNTLSSTCVFLKNISSTKSNIDTHVCNKHI